MIKTVAFFKEDRMRNKKSHLHISISDMLMHLSMMLISFICLYPFILSFMVSISSEESIVNNGFKMIPEQFSMVAYKTVFMDGSIYTGYLVTIFVTFVGTLLALLLTAMAAYGMANNKVQYRNVFALYLYIPTVFGAGLVPWYLVCTQILHLQNTIWALILPSLVSPFNIFLMRNYFKTIPSSLVEAAEMDGCGVIKTAFVVVFPLSKPIIATISLFAGLGYWNDWANALYFIDKKELYPLQYMLYRIESLMRFIRENGALGNIQVPSQTFQVATLFVTIGPILLLYPFIQKYFVKGIMVGAVKG
jgi:ABC-type glycerol-3-phosphate transport system permease component